MIRTYSELIRIDDFYERFEYLRLNGRIGEETFGWQRYLNQFFYRNNQKWGKTRNKIIIRDNGCDLAHADYEIYGPIYVHHLNPITIEDVEDDNPILYDPEFLICTSDNTHKAIHYGDQSLLPKLPEERRPGDTCPWK